jgi:predicted PurR-regulated permease PerM
LNTPESSRNFEKRAIESAIKIAIIATMVISTILIIKPFLIPVIWGIIIAVAVEPLIAGVTPILGGSRKLASILFAVLTITIMLTPTSMMATSSFNIAQKIGKKMEEKKLVVPPPPAEVKNWPIIGPSLSKTWTLAASNIGAVLQPFEPQLKTIALTILSSVKSGVLAFFMSIVSVIIAAIFLAAPEKGAATITKIFSRLAGDRGPEITTLATATIRGVMQGVVGVAMIQAVLGGIGMLVVDVPGTAVWTMLVLICAVIQLPPLLILGPVAGYVFTCADTTTAVLFLGWSIAVSMSDAFLKPLLMGRGVDIPMLVILLGALGGMMLFGIIGLFVGAVALAITYSLFMAWLEDHETTPPTME